MKKKYMGVCYAWQFFKGQTTEHLQAATSPLNNIDDYSKVQRLDIRNCPKRQGDLRQIYTCDSLSVQYYWCLRQSFDTHLLFNAIEDKINYTYTHCKPICLYVFNHLANCEHTMFVPRTWCVTHKTPLVK